MCSSDDALGNLFHVDNAECAVLGEALGNLLPVDDAECAVSEDTLNNLLHVDDAECAVSDGTPTTWFLEQSGDTPENSVDESIHPVIQNSKFTYFFEVGDCFVFENSKY